MLSSHHGSQLSHLFRLFTLSCSWLWIGSNTDSCRRGNRCNSNFHALQFSSKCIRLQIIKFRQEILLAFLSGGCEQVLPFLNLLHIFSHLVLQISDAVNVHLSIHVSNRLVASPQTVDHVDIGMS